MASDPAIDTGQNESSAPVAPWRRRRWLRFSLRFFLLFVLVAGTALGWVANRTERKRQEEAAIKTLGGKARVTFDYKKVSLGPSGSTYEPCGPEWMRKLLGQNFFNEADAILFLSGSNGDLKALAAFGRFRVLWMYPDSYCGSPLPEADQYPPLNVTDEGLEYIGQLTSLQELRIRCANVSDAGFRNLGKLTRLRKLDLSCLPLTDAQLDTLGAMHQLERLAIDIKDTDGEARSFSDNDLEHLQGLKRLKELHIDFKNITDAGLTHIGRLTQLERLELSGEKISDVGLRCLRTLTRIKDLSLSGTHISDAGLLNIAEMHDLESLNIYGTRITGAGLANASALPRFHRLWYGENIVPASGFAGVAELRGLDQLSLYGPAMNDESFAHVGNLPKLTYLDVDGAKITDKGMECLFRLRELRRARFSSNVHLTDAAMAYFSGCRKLTCLSIDGSDITGKGVKYLQQLPKLTELSLQSNKLGDDGLAPFAKLTQLKELRVSRFEYHAIPESGVNALRKALPNCEISD